MQGMVDPGHDWYTLESPYLVGKKRQKQKISHTCLCILRLKMNNTPSMHPFLLSLWLFVQNAEHARSPRPHPPYYNLPFFLPPRPLLVLVLALLGVP